MRNPVANTVGTNIAQAGQTRLYLGIDPGLSGAGALVADDGQLVMVEDMPVTLRGNGRVKRQVNAAELVRLLRPYLPNIRFGIVEFLAARPGQGVAGVFSLGHSFGTATAVLASIGICYELLPPSKWKALIGLPADKALVLAAARRRWPDAPLTRVKDHGRAEAIYLAELAIQRSHVVCGTEHRQSQLLGERQTDRRQWRPR